MTPARSGGGARGRSAVIVGGGIGGLAAAIALARVGIRADVYEQAPELREIGAGVAIWSNAHRALEALGVGPALRSLTTPIDIVQTRSRNGRVLHTTPLGRIHARLGASSVGIHRAELLRALAEAIDPERLHAGARVVGVVQTTSGVTLRFEDGASATADVAIGADGIFSTVRSQLFAGRDADYGGYVVWRGVVDAEMPPGWPRRASVRTMSRDQHFGVMELTRGRYFWYATRNQPRDEPEPGGRKETLLRHFGSWHRPIGDLLDATPEDGMLRHALYRRPTLPAWTSGRVTLLGDAAHPMAPSLGQGACQAIEDAVVLGSALREGNAEAGLRDYERRRRPRATGIVRWSRFFAFQEQFHNPVSAALRDLQTATTPRLLGEAVFRRFLTFDPPTLEAVEGSYATVDA